MRMLRKYISLFMSMCLLFPIGEKAMHDIKHMYENHCEIKKTHYCKTEPVCAICDYVFSSPSSLPLTQNQIVVFGQLIIVLNLAIVFNTIIPTKFTFTLRGPPAYFLSL